MRKKAQPRNVRTVSEALMGGMIAEKALPFKAKTPNQRTIAAMAAARKGKVESTTLSELKRECKKIQCGK